MALIETLIADKWLESPQIIEAFKVIKRADFLTDNVKNLSELNEPLPIGYGQTNSQPSVVAFMLELLSPQPGQKILEIGAGSGWVTALLAYIVSKGKTSKKGKVIAIERISKLKEFGEQNLKKYNFIKSKVVDFLCKNGKEGYQDQAPYDGIIVSAALSDENIPVAWKQQLKVGGKVVVPIKNAIYVFTKKSEQEFEKKIYRSFSFVPFIEEK